MFQKVMKKGVGKLKPEAVMKQSMSTEVYKREIKNSFPLDSGKRSQQGLLQHNTRPLARRAALSAQCQLELA